MQKKCTECNKVKGCQHDECKNCNHNPETCAPSYEGEEEVQCSDCRDESIKFYAGGGK